MKKMNESDITAKSAKIFELISEPAKFMESVRQADPHVIAALIPKVSNNDSALKLSTLRDACNSVLQTKLSEKPNKDHGTP